MRFGPDPAPPPPRGFSKLKKRSLMGWGQNTPPVADNVLVGVGVGLGEGVRDGVDVRVPVAMPGTTAGPPPSPAPWGVFRLKKKMLKNDS